MNYYNYNGSFFEENEKVISVNSRGLRYGDGVFETMKSEEGKLQFAEEHFNRLWQGIELLQFKIPVHFTKDKLCSKILTLLKKNGHNGTARIRLTVFRDDGGLFDEINHTPQYLIQTWALPKNSGEWNSNGLVLGIYTGVRKSCDMLSNLKHNNFLPYVLAALYAKKQKWNDALVLNSYDRISDTTIANIFYIKSGIIYTPSLTEGCIAGIMRKKMLEFLALNGWPVNETEVTTHDLLTADEVFLTNSVYNIRWVQMIGEKKYINTLTQRIYSSFRSTFF